MTSYYAVQNTNMTTSTNISVLYKPGDYTQDYNGLGPGAKVSFDTCNATPTAWTGSAVVTSTATDIIAVGKISGNGADTAYVGFPPPGATKLSFPYVRYANDAHYASGYMPRTFLAIQNIGSGTIPAGAITVQYYDRDGNVSGTHTNPDPILQYAKFNSNPANAGLTEFGCYNSCTQYGGSAIATVTGAYQIAAIARVSNMSGSQEPSEDYNGIPIN